MTEPKLFAEQIQDAAASQTPVVIQGGGSKSFYGNPVVGTPLSTTGYSGIISYEPSELIITAKAGTPLSEIEQVLERHNQMLGFEPPYFASSSTLGGTVACGLSGPRRPYAGAVRDFVLGITMINGKGEILKFGGQVMKNVAGYDLSRLMCGSLGTLGLLLEITLKVVPKPHYEETRVLAADQEQAKRLLSTLGCQPVPISATLLDQDQLYVRLSGAQGGVSEAIKKLGGIRIDDAGTFWRDVREQQHAFFDGAAPLWRISLPPMADSIPAELINGSELIEWGGALRWAYSHNGTQLQQWAKQNGGHASCFKNASDGIRIFSPLEPVLYKLHKHIKASFDPENILNPGRLYAEL